MLTINSPVDSKLSRQLKALSLPANKRKLLHKRIGREVIKTARQNIQQQKTVEGKSFAPRKNGKRAKMLRRIARGGNLKIFSGANKVTVTWPNSLIGKVARAQQDGFEDKYTAERMKKEHGQPDYGAPATSEQAKALLKSGFRLNAGKFKSGKNKGATKTRRVSQAWVKENMTIGQAGIVLRLLRNKASENSWIVKNAARPFFGLSHERGASIGNEILNEILNGSTKAR